MTCQICKHEWCWICKEDFPVHQPTCPNYYQYLEVLEFQGQIDFDRMDINMWFIRSTRSGFFYWLGSVLFLLIIVMPLIILLNVLLTPLYVYFIAVNTFSINRRALRVWYKVIALIFLFLLAYIFVPVIFFVLTLPQIFIFMVKKGKELKELCKNRMRFYHKLNPTPIMRRFLRKIRFMPPLRR